MLPTMAALNLPVLGKKTVLFSLLLLVHFSLSQSAPNCSTGFPEEPQNTTQFLTNEDGAIWTGLQVVIPEMKFTCSGTITAWTGWFTLRQEFQFSQSVRMQIWRPSCTEDQELELVGSNIVLVQHNENTMFYEANQPIQNQFRIAFQPGDVIGFQVLIPSGSVQPATPLISNSSDLTMYYTSFTLQPSHLSLCDPKIGKLKGIQPQVSPIVEISDETQQQPCVDFHLSSCMQSSEITSTVQSTTPTPSPTSQSELPVATIAAGVSVFVVVLLAVVTGVVIGSILLCVTRSRHAKTRSQDIEHYEAKTGDIYAAPRSRSGTGNSLVNNETYLSNGNVIGVIQENWNDNVSRDEDTPPPPPPPLQPLLTRLGSVSSSISMLSPQQKVFPMQRMNHSTQTLASPYMQPQRSPTKMTFRSRSTTLPRLDTQRPSSGKRSGSPHKQPRKNSLPVSTLPLKHIHSPPILPPPPYQTSSSMATIPLAEEPDSSYPFCNQPFDIDHQAQHYMEPLQLRELPSKQPQEAFPYADPVSISPVKEKVDSPRTAVMPGKYNTLPYQRSGAFAEENLASPYMEPSPVMRAKLLGGDHTFGERTGTESTSGSHGMFYIPHDDLNQVESPTFDLGPDCFHVPNYKQRLEFESEDFNENIYSKLERKNNCQAQSYPNNELSPQFWHPPSTSEELYDQLAAKDYREIPRKKIGVTDNIGSGHFGTVSKGVWQIKGGHMEVAVKALKPDAPEDEEVKFLQEAAIMGQFYHNNIVKLHGVVTLGKPLMIVLELMPRGDLKHYLKRQRRRITKLSKREYEILFLKFGREIVSGMNYLAEKKYVHRDLAARNILLTDDLTCKIGDFGMARDLSMDVAESCGGKIPLKWTAPEAVQCRKYTTASDVWSYGMVLYEIWTLGKKPFEKMDIKTLLSVMGTGYCHSPPPGCPRSIYHLMIKCWHPIPNLRPHFSEIYAELNCSDDEMLWWSPQDEMLSSRCTELGAPLEEGQNLYPDLQIVYKMEDLMSP